MYHAVYNIGMYVDFHVVLQNFADQAIAWKKKLD